MDGGVDVLAELRALQRLENTDIELVLGKRGLDALAKKVNFNRRRHAFQAEKAYFSFHEGARGRRQAKHGVTLVIPISDAPVWRDRRKCSGKRYRSRLRNLPHILYGRRSLMSSW